MEFRNEFQTAVERKRYPFIIEPRIKPPSVFAVMLGKGSDEVFRDAPEEAGYIHDRCC